MPTHTIRRAGPVLLFTLPLMLLMSGHAGAVRDEGIACPRDPAFRNPKYRYCAAAGTSCGVDWACKTINVWDRSVDPPKVVGSDCACVDDKTIWSYIESWLSVGTRSAQQTGPLLANTSTGFQMQYAPGDSLYFIDSHDIEIDGDVFYYQVLAGPSDVTGTFTVTLESGPAGAIPARITALNLAIASFTWNGLPTGPNTVQLAAGGGSVLGNYDSTQGEILFESRIPCVWTSPRWPEGRSLSVRPYLKATGGGMWRMSLGGYSDFEISALPGTTFPSAAVMTGLVTVAGVWVLTRRRRKLSIG